MPVDRDKEGKIREIPSEFTDTDEDRPTVFIERGKTNTPSSDSSDRITPRLNPNNAVPEDSFDDGNKKTKIIIGNPDVESLIRNYQSDSDTHPKPRSREQLEKVEDFATAALIITKGYGIGQVVTMGMGMNSVGKAKSQRVCLDFGDNTISRENHCRLIYDTRESEYLIAAGDSANLVYLNNQRVIEPQTLKHGDTIEIGETHLRFIPFCDDTFRWNK